MRGRAVGIGIVAPLLEGSAQQAPDLLQDGRRRSASTSSIPNVNAKGLRGSRTGLHAVHYEHCIPAGQRHPGRMAGVSAVSTHETDLTG
jgi:hypothetical protein